MENPRTPRSGSPGLPAAPARPGRPSSSRRHSPNTSYMSLSTVASSLVRRFPRVVCKVALTFLSLSTSLLRQASTTDRWMNWSSTLMTLPVVVVFFLAQRYFVRGIVLTGLGGR